MEPQGRDQPADSEAGFGLDAFRQVSENAGPSLAQLSAAFAGMLDAGDDPYSPSAGAATAGTVGDKPPLAIEPAAGPSADDHCEITPRSILEAMFFVGSPGNEPLTAKQVAGLMRGVRPAEVEQLVVELNETYRRRHCPYTIAAEGAGFRLKLCDRYARLRDKFYGRARQARLSQAAIEVLSIVAYRAPVTSDDIARLRGTPSGHILTQLVRRQLLRIERGGSPRRTCYLTTERFLKLFGLQSLDDLPRNADFEEL